VDGSNTARAFAHGGRDTPVSCGSAKSSLSALGSRRGYHHIGEKVDVFEDGLPEPIGVRTSIGMVCHSWPTYS
jgi:hypothetical protein